MSKDYITVSEAAGILKVSKFQVYHLIKGRRRRWKHNEYFEPPKITAVIKKHKDNYTWYLINKHAILEYRNERAKTKQSS